MAIGISRLFGIRLPPNFNSPYQSTSIREFWRRWHMTLSRFLRDNLYISLGGNQKGTMRTLCNVMVVMGLCGLWHGSGWTYIVWGLIHGAYLVVDNLWRICPVWLHWGKKFIEIRKFLCWAATLLAVVFAWVVFRSTTLSAAMYMWIAMLSPTSNLFLPLGAPDSGPIPYEYLPGWRVFLLPEGILPHFGGWSQISWLAASFSIVLALPNTQSWLADIYPVLTSNQDKKSLKQVQPVIGTLRILFVGVLFASGVGAIWFSTIPSSLLYSRF